MSSDGDMSNSSSSDESTSERRTNESTTTERKGKQSKKEEKKQLKIWKAKNTLTKHKTSRPLDVLTDCQEKKLHAHVLKQHKVIKFLHESQKFDSYITVIENNGELDRVFKALGMDGRGPEMELKRARSWVLVATSFQEMLRQIKDIKISRWRDHIKGACQHYL